MKKIDWNRPIQAVFKEQEPLKAFIVGDNESGNKFVGINDPDVKDIGLIVEIDDFGNVVESGRPLIENVGD
jgi:hypothetical protein